MYAVPLAALEAGLASTLQAQGVVDPELLQAVVNAEAAAKGHGGEEGNDIDGHTWMSAREKQRRSHCESEVIAGGE